MGDKEKAAGPVGITYRISNQQSALFFKALLSLSRSKSILNCHNQDEVSLPTPPVTTEEPDEVQL